MVRGAGTPSGGTGLMLEGVGWDSWIYRREPRVRRHLDSLVYQSSNGIPYLAPEVQLLYKAKHLRPRDELDFEAVIPRLSTEARGWLQRSLFRSLPSHRWSAAIERHCVA